ncbi:MAG: prepilin-type N-terminal cleavage/methylation domain-containing protein [Burkholderiaceae bacterium]
MNAPTVRRQRGVSLIESLISLAILSFGILGLARFQIGMLKQTTDSQNRIEAATLSQELLSYVRIDAANAACYTVPQSGACGSDVAKALAAAWAAEAAGKGFTTAVASMPTATQFKTSLTWNSQAFHATRTLEATTDARL